MKFDDELIARMDAHIDKNGAGGCWLSLYKPNKNGQSRIEIDGKSYKFGRVMLFYSDQSKTFEFQNSKIWEACHKCTTKNCVNPEHLEWGTHPKNMKDKVRDGTLANGEKNGQAKLTDAQVLEIRREYAPPNKTTQQKLAEKYGVAQTIICHIINRKRWKHI